MKSYSITDCGKRRTMNQDYVFTSVQSVGKLPNLFIVADGMGGHNAGDFASKFTVNMLVDFMKDSGESDPFAIIGTSIKRVNKELIEKAATDETLAGMGTTLVVATIIEGRLYIANIGDSRLYVVGSHMKQITKDHSLVEEMIRLGEIDRENARVHPDKNIITRAIGADFEVEVDFFEEQLEENHLILMCTDGLTNMIEDKELEKILLENLSIEEKARELVNKANSNGGKDNITVVIIEPFSGEVREC